MRYSTIFLLLLALTACGDTTTSTDEAAAPEATTTPAPPLTQPDPASTYAPAPKPLAAGDELFPWVDNVNVRDRATTDGKRVARIPAGEALTWTGQKSSGTDAVLLRGMVYEEPWYEVKTKDGTAGWVFGGTVKRKDEKKGNPLPSDTKLFFPHFGTYDLSDWEQLPSVDESGGDATIIVQTWEKDGRKMTIDRTDVGEYGYSETYVLYGLDRDTILLRKLNYDGTEGLLTERVENRIQSPAIEYTRSQTLNSNPYQLGGKPLLVNGEWTERPLR